MSENAVLAHIRVVADFDAGMDDRAGTDADISTEYSLGGNAGVREIGAAIRGASVHG
jgi:hypothetical protein